MRWYDEPMLREQQQEPCGYFLGKIFVGQEIFDGFPFPVGLHDIDRATTLVMPENLVVIHNHFVREVERRPVRLKRLLSVPTPP